MLKKMQLYRYLLEIAFYLPVPWKQKKEILRKIKHSIESYIFDGDYISYRQIRSRFGDPQQIAMAYLTEMDPEELMEKVNQKRIVVRIFVTVVVVALTLLTVSLVRNLVSFMKDMNGYDTIEIIENTRYEIE